MNRYVPVSEAKNIAKFIASASFEEVEQLKKEISELSNANEVYLAVTAELFELLKDDLLKEITSKVFEETQQASEEVEEVEECEDFCDEDCDCEYYCEREEEEDVQETVLASLQKQALSKAIAEQLAQQELSKSIAEQIAESESISAEAPVTSLGGDGRIVSGTISLAELIQAQTEPQLLSSLIQQLEDEEEENVYGLEEVEISEPFELLAILDEIADDYVDYNYADADGLEELALDNETIDRLSVQWKSQFYYGMHAAGNDFVDYQEDFTAYILSKVASRLVLDEGFEMGFSVKNGSVVPSLAL